MVISYTSLNQFLLKSIYTGNMIRLIQIFCLDSKDLFEVIQISTICVCCMYYYDEAYLVGSISE